MSSRDKAASAAACGTLTNRTRRRARQITSATNAGCTCLEPAVDVERIVNTAVSLRRRRSDNTTASGSRSTTLKFRAEMFAR